MTEGLIVPPEREYSPMVPVPLPTTKTCALAEIPLLRTKVSAARKPIKIRRRGPTTKCDDPIKHSPCLCNLDSPSGDASLTQILDTKRDPQATAPVLF